MRRRKRIEAVIENPNDYSLAYPCPAAETLADDMYAELRALWAIHHATRRFFWEQDDSQIEVIHAALDAYEADND